MLTMPRAILCTVWGLLNPTCLTRSMDDFLDTLTDVLDQLDRGVEAYATNPDGEFVRDALITRFTFTFSQVITTLGRYLDEIYCLPDARMLSPRQCIRHAARLGLIDNCEAWLQHVENRNRDAHAYLEAMAIAVANGAPAFAADARALLNAMQQGIADGG